MRRSGCAALLLSESATDPLRERSDCAEKDKCEAIAMKTSAIMGDVRGSIETVCRCFTSDGHGGLRIVSAD